MAVRAGWPGHTCQVRVAADDSVRHFCPYVRPIVPAALAITRLIDDALIQPHIGHATRQSPEIYSRLALADARQRYEGRHRRLPV